MRRCLIIEDKNNDFNRLKDCIAEMKQLLMVDNNNTSSDIIEAKKYIGTPTDIIFLDNQLGRNVNEREHSIDFLSELNNYYSLTPQRRPAVIVCTSYPNPEEVPNVFKNIWELDINDFISKPVTVEKIQKSLDSLISRRILPNDPDEILNLSSWSYELNEKRLILLSSSEVLYIETQGNYSTFVRVPSLNQNYQNILRQRRDIITTQREQVGNKTASISIKQLVLGNKITVLTEAITVLKTHKESLQMFENLPFFDTHQSYIINCDLVSNFGGTSVVFSQRGIDGIVLNDCISNARRKEFRNLFGR
jgi:DNA-binding LytR/AlgR family response regulator